MLWIYYKFFVHGCKNIYLWQGPFITHHEGNKSGIIEFLNQFYRLVESQGKCHEIRVFNALKFSTEVHDHEIYSYKQRKVPAFISDKTFAFFFVVRCSFKFISFFSWILAHVIHHHSSPVKELQIWSCCFNAKLQAIKY